MKLKEERVTLQNLLTKYPNVQVCQLLSKSWENLLTICEVHCNHTDISTILLLWRVREREGGKELEKVILTRVELLQRPIR